MGELPDEVLKDIRGEAVDADTVALKGKDPLAPDADHQIGLMVRRDGKWVVPAATALGLDPAPAFAEPPEAEREDLLKQARALTRAAKSILQRLQKKEFKTPVEVQEALNRGLVEGTAK